jgi:hypothetical protein
VHLRFQILTHEILGLGKLQRIKLGPKSTRFRIDDVENITSIDEDKT